MTIHEVEVPDQTPSIGDVHCMSKARLLRHFLFYSPNVHLTRFLSCFDLIIAISNNQNFAVGIKGHSRLLTSESFSFL